MSVYAVLPARWGSKSVRHFVSLYELLWYCQNPQGKLLPKAAGCPASVRKLRVGS